MAGTPGERSGRTDGEMDTPLHWILFNIFVLAAVALDLGVFHRKAHKISLREALLTSLAWMGLALIFGGVVIYFYGRQSGLEFFTGRGWLYTKT